MKLWGGTPPSRLPVRHWGRAAAVSWSVLFAVVLGLGGVLRRRSRRVGSATAVAAGQGRFQMDLPPDQMVFEKPRKTGGCVSRV